MAIVDWHAVRSSKIAVPRKLDPSKMSCYTVVLCLKIQPMEPRSATEVCRLVEGVQFELITTLIHN